MKKNYLLFSLFLSIMGCGDDISSIDPSTVNELCQKADRKISYANDLSSIPYTANELEPILRLQVKRVLQHKDEQNSEYLNYFIDTYQIYEMQKAREELKEVFPNPDSLHIIYKRIQRNIDSYISIKNIHKLDTSNMIDLLLAPVD